MNWRAPFIHCLTFDALISLLIPSFSSKVEEMKNCIYTLKTWSWCFAPPTLPNKPLSVLRGPARAGDEAAAFY